MRIYPLAEKPVEAARYLADIHLRPSIIAVTKSLSDALHFGIGRGKVPVKVNAKTGINEFWWSGAKIYPPSGTIPVWAKWAAINYANAWWLVDYAFHMHNEIISRFKEMTPGPVPEYMMLQEWVLSGVMKVFPKTGKSTIDEFPVTLPPEEVIKLGEVVQMSVIDIYRSYYFAQRGKVRMKWTSREKPPFIMDLQDETIIKESLQDVPF